MMGISAWSILEITVDILDSFMILLLISSLLKLRHDNVLVWIISTIALAALCEIGNRICSTLVQFILYLSVILALFTLWGTRGPISTKLLCIILTQLVFFGVDMLYTSIILRILSALPSDIIYQPGPVRLFNMIVSRLLIAVIVLFIRKRNDLFSDFKEQGVLLIVCLSLSFSSLLLLAYLFAKGHVFDGYMIVSTLLLCLINTLYISLFFALKERENRLRDDSLIIQKLENDQKQNISSNQYVQELQNWKHDYRKQLQTILTITQSTDLNKEDLLYSYISEIQNGLEKTPVFVNTENPMFDSIISMNCIRAVNEGIAIQLELVVPPLDFMDSVDLSSILGNIWENSIDACISYKNADNDSPSIVFKTFVNANHFIMEMSNSSITQPDTDLKTSKTEPGHGIGIKIIKRLVSKHHGISEFTVQEGLFITRVAIPINSPSDKINNCIVFNWRSPQ